MAVRASERRDRPLQLGDIPAGGTLAILTGGLVCLAVLAMAVSAGAGTRLKRIEAEPRQMTVALPTGAGAADPPSLARLVDEIRRMPGMVALREVPAAELQALLPAGVLEAGAAPAAPFPRLLEVGFAPEAAPEPEALAARLAAVAPGVTVGAPPTDLAARTDNSRRALRLGWLGGALSLAGLVVGVALVARWALSAQAEGVRLLRSLGANDRHVSRQFEEHAARAALGGAGVGFLTALVILALLALGVRLWPEAGLVAPRLTPADWLRLAAVPVGGGLLAGWVAKLTVRIGLVRLR